MAGSSKKGSSKGPKSPKSPKSPRSTRSGKATVSKTGPVDLNIEESPKSTRNGKATAAPETKSTESAKLTRKGKAAAAPETGFNNEDYNIRSPERTELLTKIKGVISNAPVSPALWACCQLADMHRLKAITKWEEEAILGYNESLAIIAAQCELPGF